MLIQDLDVRVINAATGELIRELDIDPARDYQPLGRPPCPNQEDPEPDRGSGSFLCPERSHPRPEQDSNLRPTA